VIDLRTYPRPFQLAFGGIALLLLVVEHINGRFWLNDLRVYYGAGEALLHGTPLYGVAHGLDTGIFKYAPLLALLYAVFALLPYSIAASLQYGLIALAFIDGLRRIDELVRERLLSGKPPAYLPLLLITLTVVVHLHRELHLGNINMMLLWLLVVALQQLDRGHLDRGGLLVGLTILAKPHFLVLLPLFVLHGQWRALRSIVLAIGAGVVLPALFLGWEANLAMHRAWLGEMAAHNATLIYTGGDDHRAVNTIYSFLHRAVLSRWLGAPSSAEAYLILAAVAIGCGAFAVWNRVRRRPQAFLFAYLLLVGLVPTITLTDTEHFLFAMPLVAYLIHRMVPKADPRWLAFIAVPLLLLYGGNIEDALGTYSDVLIHFGALGIGGFGIIVLTAFVWARSNPRDSGVSNP
jgi:hypothetical protein